MQHNLNNKIIPGSRPGIKVSFQNIAFSAKRATLFSVHRMARKVF